MSQAYVETTTTKNRPKAQLVVSGIPLSCDCERFKNSLKQHSPGQEFEAQFTIRFEQASRPDRRVFVKIEGLSASLVAWSVFVIEQALRDCGHVHCEVSAILLRR
jgi:hypothetical protein